MSLTPTIRRLALESIDMFDESGKLDTQILHGQPLELLKDRDSNYVTVRDVLTGKVGNIDRTAWYLGARSGVEPTHRVIKPTAIAYRKPNFKEPRVMVLSMNALVTVGDAEEQTPEGDFIEITSNLQMGQAWIQLDQLRRLDEPLDDFVEVALRFVGRDYLWGAITAFPGIDCSGLVLQACAACGIQSPRDSGPQSRQLGEVTQTEFTHQLLRRGDLVFWTEGNGRHVAIMVNGTEAVHATISSPKLRGVGVQHILEIVRDQRHAGGGMPSVVRRFPNYLPGK